MLPRWTKTYSISLLLSGLIHYMISTESSIFCEWHNFIFNGSVVFHYVCVYVCVFWHLLWSINLLMGTQAASETYCKQCAAVNTGVHRLLNSVQSSRLKCLHVLWKMSIQSSAHYLVRLLLVFDVELYEPV